MEINQEQLVNKILSFWKEYEDKSYSLVELKQIFNVYELFAILDNDFSNSKVIDKFQSDIRNLPGLFTENEAFELFNNQSFHSYNRFLLLEYLGDEKLLALGPDFQFAISKYLSSDEVRSQVLETINDKKDRAYFLKSFETDAFKLKYLKNIAADDRFEVICSFKDESLKEKSINLFSANKGKIISSFTSDEKKIDYFKKYFKVLNNEDKSDILSSLKNDEQVLYFLRFCNDKVKAAVADNRCKNVLFVEEVIKMMSSKTSLALFLKDSSFGYSEEAIKYIDQITDTILFFDVVANLDDKYKIRYLDKFSDKQKIELITNMSDIYKFQAFKYIQDKNLLFELIEHCEMFPKYHDEYEYIIDLYTKRYNLKKENLQFVVSNISLSILKIIESPNIIKILKASPESFNKVMQFFDKEQLKMNSSAMNDILNTFLQREFRINAAEIILLFPNMLNAIENKDKEFLVEKVREIAKNFDINDELKKNNWNLSQFIDLLLDKNEKAIDCLHKFSTKFIRNSRNSYVQNNLQKAMEQSTTNKYDKNDLLKYMIANFPVEIILAYFPKYVNDKSLSYLTEEEINLIKNKELIKKIILYKKNPQNYEQIPDEVKEAMKSFNAVFEKSVAIHSINYFSDINMERKTCIFKDVDEDFLVNIMMYLDIDKMEKDLFNNKELYEKLMKLWNQYKIGGWGKTFYTLSNSTGIMVEPEIVANFIQYFGLSYESLQEKVDKGELAQISLTALLDLANCYSSESKKYAMVFGAEDFKYIASNPGPNASTMVKEKRIEKALESLRTIRNRQYVSVPSVDQDFTLKNGKNINIVVGNFSNPINLTYGERTGACMRIGGAGRSLYNFCLEDDNGFHIRFSDPNTGKFISRVSGFRNGNTVFLNELRNSENLKFNNKEVVEACQLIAQELINLSKDSTLPIDNVVITPHYAMQDSGMSEQELGIANPQQGMKRFYTDVSSTSVVLATSFQNNQLVPVKLGVKKVPKYPVKRDKQMILYNKEGQERVAHLKSLDQVLSGSVVEEVDIEVDEKIVVCFTGEDWCVTIDKEGNLNEFIMNNTNNKKQALDEVQKALAYLKENLVKEVTISNNVSLGM